MANLGNTTSFMYFTIVGEYAGDGRGETDTSESMVVDNPAEGVALAQILMLALDSESWKTPIWTPHKVYKEVKKFPDNGFGYWTLSSCHGFP